MTDTSWNVSPICLIFQVSLIIEQMRAQADGYAQANVKPSLTDYDFLWVICFFIIYKANFGIISRITEMNPYLTNVPILYPLKKPENQSFSGVFRGYKIETLIRHGLSFLLDSIVLVSGMHRGKECSPVD